MSYLQQQMNYLRYDKRLLETNLKNGTITQEEYEKFLADLNNDEGNAEKLDLASDAEVESTKESMNGDSHPAENQPAETNMPPTNTDPFGSGF